MQSYKCDLFCLAVRIWCIFLSSEWYSNKTHLGSETHVQKLQSVVKAINKLNEV